MEAHQLTRNILQGGKEREMRKEDNVGDSPFQK